MQKQSITIFGLGRMGSQIAKRLHANGFEVVAWNRSAEPVDEIKKSGIFATTNIKDAIEKTDGEPRIFWIMLPSESC